jgi:U3 small nucleolar RNA-associated protein 21
MSSDSEDLERPRKKVKGDEIGTNYVQIKENRRLFAPFRALGFVTNYIPFAMQVRSYKGATGAPRVHILACLGRAWAEFEGEKMKLLFVGQWLRPFSPSTEDLTS